MSKTSTRITALEDQLAEFQDIAPGLNKDDYLSAFVCHAIAATTVEDALAHVVGGTGDGGIDAYYVDDQIGVAFVFQIKYRKLPRTSESADSVVKWLKRLERLITADAKDSVYEAEVKKLNPKALLALSRIREAWAKGYRTILHFASTGTLSDKVREVAQDAVVDDAVVFEATDHRELPALVDAFVNGFAPAIPQIDLPLHGEVTPLKVIEGASPSIDTRVFWVDGATVAELYQRYERRLFELNIRGFLQGPISIAIRNSVLSNPEGFFYQNNGITFVCEKLIRRDDKLTLIRPQIVNGQQTTRSLHLAWEEQPEQVEISKVLVKVVAVPQRSKNAGDQSEFLSTVRRIVESSNRQNAISARDLISNDPRQIQIERELGALGYTYVRKKMSAGEIPFVFADKPIRRIKLDDVVRLLGSSELENYVGTIGPSETLDDAKTGDSYDRMFRDEVNGLSIAIRFELFEKVKVLIRKPRNGNAAPHNKAKWPILFILWQDLRFLDKSQPILRSLSRLNPRNPTDGFQRRIVEYVDGLKTQMDRYFAHCEKSAAEPIDISKFYDKQFSIKEFRTWQKQSIRRGTSEFDRLAAVVKKVKVTRPTK